jgi:hypothetical protein
VYHDSNYPSASCSSCHVNHVAWVNGTSNHTHLMPLTGNHALTITSAFGTGCNNCHNNTLGQTHTDWTCSSCHMNFDTGHGDYVNATNPVDHVNSKGAWSLPTTCDTCHTYQNSWTTTLNPHSPTGNGSGTPPATSCSGSGDGFSTATPWNHENVVSCSDCHASGSVTSMTAGNSWGCANCHAGHHGGQAPGTCPKGG